VTVWRRRSKRSAGTRRIAVMQLGGLDPPRFPVKSTREQRVAVVEQAVLASLETCNIKRQVRLLNQC
jgi:hypothetical protein